MTFIDLIDNYILEKIILKRKILKLTRKNEKHQKSWKSVLFQIPTEYLRELAVTCEEFKFSVSHCAYSPLHTAACNGNLQLFKYIAEKSKIQNPKDNTGSTPLHIAAEKGRFQICQFIMENTTDINPRDELGIDFSIPGHRCKLFSILKLPLWGLSFYTL